LEEREIERGETGQCKAVGKRRYVRREVGRVWAATPSSTGE
jgi:hypothetical protein